jgi:hypothetical protein
MLFTPEMTTSVWDIWGLDMPTAFLDDLIF